MGDDGLFPPGRGEQTSGRSVEVGYEGDSATLEEAVDEAKDLSRHLPKSVLYSTQQRLADVLEKVNGSRHLGEEKGRTGTQAPFSHGRQLL